jgi:hypothetical protein
MGQYDRQIVNTLRLIAKKGVIVTWTKRASSSADPTMAWKTSISVPLTYQVSMVFVSPKGTLADMVALLKGTTVPVGAINALMASVPFTPAIDDSIVTVGRTFIVKSIDIVQPNLVPILYKLKLL